MDFAETTEYQLKIKDSENEKYIWTLPENWKSYGTSKWRGYQSQLESLEQFQRNWLKDWVNWRSEAESKLSKPQHC